MATGQAGGFVIKVTETSLAGMMVLEPRVFGDSRGFFMESYNENTMAGVGIQAHFVQDNHSYSTRNVLRGLHYQVQRAQGKLVRVVGGEILDVAVDLRRKSPTLGQWHSVHLSGENRRMVWVPPGFAHGFRVISEGAHVLYKTTDFYFPEFEHTIAWNDPTLAINWELEGAPVVSARDQKGIPFRRAELYS